MILVGFLFLTVSPLFLTGSQILSLFLCLKFTAFYRVDINCLERGLLGAADIEASSPTLIRLMIR